MAKNMKERELLLKTEFDCVKGEEVLFKVDKNTYRGTVVDLFPHHEFACNYFTDKVPDSRNKCFRWQDADGYSINCVLLCVMTGKNKNLPTYYTATKIIRKIEK